MADRSRQTDLQQKMWRTYRAELLAFVRRRLSDEAAAEDVVQDVLAKAYADLGRLKDETRLRPYHTLEAFFADLEAITTEILSHQRFAGDGPVFC